MKPSVTPDATRAVLADIADAVRPVERARTAAAVDRVLSTACAGMQTCTFDGWLVARSLCDELSLDVVDGYSHANCPCQHQLAGWSIPRQSATPGLVMDDDPDIVGLPDQRRRYAPWVVSPHLFDTRSDPAPSGSNQRRRVTTQQQGEYQ